MAKTLTAAAVKNYRPGKKRREIPDGGCPGLHLVVQPSGAKSWALRYRRPDKRTAKLVLGSVFERDGQERDNKLEEPDTKPVIGGHLTLAAAHLLVAELRHQIAQGRDPGAAYLVDRERRRAATLDRAANTSVQLREILLNNTRARRPAAGKNKRGSSVFDLRT
ncbi:Arm DNA-binding domain-containing protein [Bradyrhizobium sp. LLZ17]|uniref:Arm DNA-binding domain-containing protein n=1 Tax=Bradyrhizobium sp. LLZ17 TaxID=3239388 RepID=A0AB39XE52_9BRAD